MPFDLRTRAHRSSFHACAIAPFLASFVATHAAAHDFWIQPDAFRGEPQQTVALTLQVGHGPARQRSPMPARRIVRFDRIAADGHAIDLRERLHPGADTDDGDIRFDDAGTYLLVLETDDRAQSHLPAIRFNDYATAEGLVLALASRARDGRMDLDATESYSRAAKALVRIGDGHARSASPATRAVGLALEIVPEADPYAEPPPATLPVRVIYEGRPLAGALVKLTQLEHDDSPLETHTTDAEGRARFALRTRGSWLFNVVWTRPLPAPAQTDFETVFSSLSFGFDAAPE